MAELLVVRLAEELAARRDRLFVGIDGRSGAGKSTLAATVAARLGATIIEGDQFYAGGTARTWDDRTPGQNADRVIDWRRQRSVLEQLRDHGVAEWSAFDWDSDRWDGDVVPLERHPIVAHAGPLVLLEGAYSCRPELHDLLDLRVLLDAPNDVRRRRLVEREGGAHRSDWDARWSAAEDHYFGAVMPPERFDVVLDAP